VVTANDPTLKIQDFSFEPQQMRTSMVAAADVLLTNRGLLPHNLSIDTLGVSVDLAPGDFGVLTLEAPPGVIEVYCNIPGHRDIGMVGTLRVE
jgi:uncharacterized cupredoxin-like copper-binding protein